MVTEAGGDEGLIDGSVAPQQPAEKVAGTNVELLVEQALANLGISETGPSHEVYLKVGAEVARLIEEQNDRASSS